MKAVKSEKKHTPPLKGHPSQEGNLAEAFGSMIEGLKKQAADRWGFWKKTLEDLAGTEDDLLVLKETEPVVLRSINNEQLAMSNKKQKKEMMLIVKCGNSVVRYELYRSQFMLMEALNKNMPEGEVITKIVFR